MFARELANVAPDVMCLSKGITGGFLPMGATVLTHRIFETFESPDPARAFWHGHSYTGNPLACAAALASLEIFRTEPVFERIGAISNVHAERLALACKQSESRRHAPHRNDGSDRIARG